MTYLIILKGGKKIYVDLDDEKFEDTVAKAFGYSTNPSESFVRANGILIRLSEINLVANQEKM